MPVSRWLGNPKGAEAHRVAGLAKKAVRVETGRFLVEGPQAVGEALRWHPEDLEALYLTDEADFKYPQLGQQAETHGIDLVSVTIPVIQAMADTVSPQGVVAVAKQHPMSHRDLFAKPRKLIALLQNVRDPGNAGTILRAADAAGADAVVFAGRSVDVYNPKVVRSTTGSIFHIPVVVAADAAEIAGEAKAAGMQVFATSAVGVGLPQMRAQLAQPTVWIYGNEASGLDDADFALATQTVALPIYGKAESLNLATAASVTLYESAFAQAESNIA